MTGRRISARNQRVVELASTADGTTISDIMAAHGLARKSAGCSVDSLVRMGLLYSAAWPKLVSPRRFFATEECRDAWLSSRGSPLGQAVTLILETLASRTTETTTLELSSITGLRRGAVWRRLSVMASSGLIYARRIGRDSVYFKDKATFEAWGSQAELKFHHSQMAKRSVRPWPGKPGSELVCPAKPSVRQPVKTATQAWLSAEADFSRAKYERDTAPRPRARWEALDLPPDPRWPAFASTRPSQDPLTGRDWGS